MNDPRATREGLSVIPLGHRTYLDAKAKGESSMFGKSGCQEITNWHARQDPDGMAKATLPEPKYPNYKAVRLDTVIDIQCFQNIRIIRSLMPQGRDVTESYDPHTLHGSWVTISNLKGTKWAPKPS